MLLKLFWDIAFSLLGYLAVNRLANCFSLAKIELCDRELV